MTRILPSIFVGVELNNDGRKDHFVGEEKIESHGLVFNQVYYAILS